MKNYIYNELMHCVIKYIHYKNIYFKNIKIFIYILLIFSNLSINYKVSLAPYRNYINDCINLKQYNRIKIKNNNPYFSICLPTYNMEKYIERVVLSIINQNFQDFEIIIVNDKSNDQTENIIQRIKIKDSRIKVINHLNNQGVYNSRVDAIFASKGKYIILMDPDDMFLNPNLFYEIYNYNLKFNLDIIEFTVFSYNERKSFLTKKLSKYHYHNLKGIINQPELSTIFFFDPNYKNYTSVQCRNIWNKSIRREIVLNTINYIGIDYYKKFFITAEDTIINLISLHFANNYTNIKIPGYMYNIREKSMTHGKFDNQKKILFNYNHLLYLRKFYLYLKDFNLDRNFLYFEIIKIKKLLLSLKNLTNSYDNELKIFFKYILSDYYCGKKFKKLIKNITSIYFHEIL